MKTTYYEGRVPFTIGDEEFQFSVKFSYYPSDARDTPPSPEEIEILDFDVSQDMERNVVRAIVEYLMVNRYKAKYLGTEEDTVCLNQH